MPRANSVVCNNAAVRRTLTILLGLFFATALIVGVVVLPNWGGTASPPASVSASFLALTGPPANMLNHDDGFGFGLASAWQGNSLVNYPGAMYETSDAGSRWRLVSAAWSDRTLQRWKSASWFRYATRSTGWMFNGRLYSFTHGGAALRPIRFGGTLIGDAVSTTTVFVDRSTGCSLISPKQVGCVNVIESHALAGGRWRSWPSVKVPMDPLGPEFGSLFQNDALVATQGASTAIIYCEAGDEAINPLVAVTTDAGRIWTTVNLPNPPSGACEYSPSARPMLTYESATHWLDVCEFTSSTFQPSYAIFATTNAGRTWRDVAGCSGTQTSCRGGLDDDVIDTVISSSSGRVLYALAAPSLWVSHNGGTTWSSVSTSEGVLGGVGGAIEPLGSNGAVVFELNQAPWFTVNGRSWREG
jgi:hypothetical protein